MGVEREEIIKREKETVEHFYSPVVESISVLSLIIENKNGKLSKEIQEKLYKEFSLESQQFVKKWRKLTDWSFIYLLNFLLPCPIFFDLELFNEKLRTLSDENFLFHSFEESLALKDIQALLDSPERLHTIEETIWWETDQKRLFIKEFISNLGWYRTQLYQLLKGVAQSQTLKRLLEDKREQVSQVLAELEAIQMEPLALAQYVMGKTFRRTSLYERYAFIPAFYVSPERIRIFNTKVCYVIYSATVPLSDVRETSRELEKQVKALADQNRLLILRMLDGRKEYGAKIAEYLGITTATVSHHLEILKKAGFIQEEKVGTIKYFSLNQEHAQSTLNNLHRFIARH